jgi:triphosphoribosyl-dephospho-CoA synthase
LTALQFLRNAVRLGPCKSTDDDETTQVAIRNAIAIELACCWEATAPKVGNVHPDAAFDDCCYEDFCRAGKCIGPILAGLHRSDQSTISMPIGERILTSIEATRSLTAANINLGIVLLIAPLALANDREDISGVLSAIDKGQTSLVYRAIGLAKPGGMNRPDLDAKWDVRERSDAKSSSNQLPPDDCIDLITAMRMARNHDRIALQYSEDFIDFFESVIPLVESELARIDAPCEAIVRAQLRLLADQPDSLIARKCGMEVAKEAMQRAADCFDAQGNLTKASVDALDRWMRADGNRRNPGTTADLIAAAIYWLIR